MLRNREGRPVDPVPFVVVSGFAFLGCYSFFPVYLASFGVAAPAALAATTLVFAALTAGSYYRLVWTARPDIRREVPPELRIQHILYGALAVTGVLLLLTLVMVAR